MDANKLKVLHDVGYVVQTSCSTCLYSDFPSDEWGTCNMHEYRHEKHTGESRKLSINRCGICPKFEAAYWKLPPLGGFIHMLEYTNDMREGRKKDQ